jgi:Fe-S oxidoreductase
MTYNEPQVGIAATELLEAAGYEVLLPRRRCCGRPMISKGLLEEARQVIAYNLAQLAPYAERGIPIVGCEPSCILTFRDEAPDLFPDDERAALLARGSWTVEEFLSQLADAGELELPWDGRARAALLHGHCHQKALVGTGPAEMLLRLAGCTVQTVDSSCCGMAGSFGYEAEHYDISLAMGRLRLFPAVQAASPAALIVASGTSCRQQIAHATGRAPLHLVEALRVCCRLA